MNFDEARHRLVDLLAHVQWPREIAWVRRSHIVTFPERVFVFADRGEFEPECAVQDEYASALKKCPAVRLGAVGIAQDKTLAAVFPIYELDQGEAMFIDRGVKIDVPAVKLNVEITSSSLKWWFISRSYRKWVHRRDAALGIST